MLWVERALISVGIALLGWYVVVWVEAFAYQRYEDGQLDAILKSRLGAATTPIVTAEPPVLLTRAPSPDALIGRLELPRLRIAAIVREGSDATTLKRAIGHVPGTAMPGTAGNVGLAAHRDTFFRRLKDVREGDEILLVTPDGRFRYRVRDMEVVAPRDTWVLDATPRPALTLVTCYPFHFIGSAPQRYIVRADQIIAQYTGESTHVTNRLTLPLDTVVAAHLRARDVRPAARRVRTAPGRGRDLRPADRPADRKTKSFWKRVFGAFR